ncbi:MAG: translocation/assembly module TamB domain-containing protein, partial [Deltaproteobacteria bacterium]|nr:translocation/assembly module TamB domain-containing protein [Deltaproteobacteria bacterium]
SEHVSLGSILEAALGQHVVDVEGYLDAKLSVKGSAARPEVDGALEVADIVVALPYMDSRLVGSVRVTARSTGIFLVSPGLAIDDVPLHLFGEMPLSGDLQHSFRGGLRANALVLRKGRSVLTGIDIDTKIEASSADAIVSVTSTVTVGGGTIVLHDAGPLYMFKHLLQRAVESSEAPLEPQTSSASAEWPLSLSLDFHTANPIHVRNPLLDLSVKARATLRISKEQGLHVDAEAEVPSGSIFFHSNEFKIVKARGRVRVVGEAMTSEFDVEATASVAEHSIRLYAKGSIDDPNIRLESTPARTEVEIVHLLSTGTLPGDAAALSKVGAGVRDFYMTSSINRFLSSSFGLSSVRVRRDGDVSRVDVDKQLDDRTTVSYSRGTDKSDVLKVEYRIGGSATVEAGQKTDSEGTRPFVGVKRRLRFR